jgi:hypothetical protein
VCVQRNGEDVRDSEVLLAAGDTLLVQGAWAELEPNRGRTDVLVVDEPTLVLGLVATNAQAAGRRVLVGQRCGGRRLARRDERNRVWFAPPR